MILCSHFLRLQQFIHSVTNIHFIDLNMVIRKRPDHITLPLPTQATMSNISFAQFRPKRSSLLSHVRSGSSSTTSSNGSQPFEIFVDRDCIHVEEPEPEQPKLLRWEPKGPYITITEEFTGHLTSNEFMDRMAGTLCPQTGGRIVPTSTQLMVDLVLKNPERYNTNAHFMAAATVKHYSYLLALRDTSYYPALVKMYANTLPVTWPMSLKLALEGTIDGEFALRCDEELDLTAEILHMIPMMIERALKTNYSNFFVHDEGFMPLDYPMMLKYASATRNYQKKLRSGLERSFIWLTVLEHEIFDGEGEKWAELFGKQRDMVHEMLRLIDRRVAIYDEIDTRYLRDITRFNEKLPDPRLHRPDGRDGDENAFL